MVAAEYLEYDRESNRYFMINEQAPVLADEDSPTFLGGAFQSTIPSILQVSKVMNVFRHGEGVLFSELGSEVAEGIDRLHRLAFVHSLTKEWLPNVPGLGAKLKTGISVLDVGFG